MSRPGDVSPAPADAVTTILVHGVGLWPGTFSSLADRLDGPTVTWTRPGYGSAAPSAGLAVARFEDQIGALADMVAANAPARVVGVSGGATLALALAISVDAPDGLGSIVTHEPLIGRLEPALDQRVRTAGQQLAAAPSPAAADQFLAGLYGPAWLDLPPEAHEWARAHAHIVCAEVNEFASFQPDTNALSTITVDHLTTVGAESAPDRHRVAALLAGHGARAETIDGSGHLASVDNPDGLAALINQLSTRLETP